ncbi:MAG: hypothetical protein DMG44_03905 [Acidobacteria bacterium]|jgi:excisionase family DNA binding protein|nr:MAG: hypothetical protein DMG44_03905 [Acidobacteriota bacterium]
MESSVRVVVANRPRLLRELVLATLSGQAGIEVVGEAENEQDVPLLVAATKPDFLLIALEESRRRPPLCDLLLRKFPRLKKKWMSPPSITVPVVSAPPTPCKDFMNLKEAAVYFGVSVWSVRGLIAKGFITAKRIGKYDVVRRADLAAYWEKAAA